MAHAQTTFFATEDDLAAVLSQAEAAIPLKYTLTGLFSTDHVESYLSYHDIPNLCRATHPVAVANPTYLVSLREAEITLRKVPQTKGGCLFAVDQFKNPETVTLRPTASRGDTIMLAGMIGTVSQATQSRTLYRRLLTIFRENFSKRREFLIGPEAARLLIAGARLTIGADSPKEFDLAIDA